MVRVFLIQFQLAVMLLCVNVNAIVLPFEEHSIFIQSNSTTTNKNTILLIGSILELCEPIRKYFFNNY